MNYSDWQVSIPATFKNDSLWRMTAYRLALFLGDVSWVDVTKLIKDHRTMALSDQLYRAVGSISANLAEGYSRGTSRDRARFYEYSLGSAREARDWYFKGRHILGTLVVDHRFGILTEIIRLLLTMIPHQRGIVLKEDEVPYGAKEELPVESEMGTAMTALLNNVPWTED